jgi:DNA polymerase-3 subunit delta
MAGTETPLGRVTLVTGKEEFLGERTVAAAREAVRRFDPEAELSETQAAGLTLATFGELAAPSLFSSVRCVVVRGLEELPDESVDGLLDYAAAPADDIALVLVHSGGARGSGVLAKLRKLPAVTEHKSAEIKSWEFPGFVAAEVKAHGGQVDRDAAQALVDAVGQNLRALAAAADQLVADAAGKPLDTELVQRYFGGRAEGKAYAIADAALVGDREKSLEELRWAMATGMAPTYLTAAFAGSTRSLAMYVAAPKNLREADVAAAAGVPTWKLKQLKPQSRGWTEAGLARAIRAVAQADADVKGAASDANYTLERLVLTITGLREPH